jgi:hypothetical protein
MPEFAEINTQTNEVLRVIGAKSKLWCEYELDGTWVNARYDTPGKNFAGIGFVYHPDKENFSPPQPYPRVIKCIHGMRRPNHGMRTISSRKIYGKVISCFDRC